ncbi:unnamed protein product [Phaedon cochleariae]|uniref:Histone deacetylase complex subunit SAP130 C-terminal domain-containing protein n=1 Tax=Phaedon cochleariae TaxID=80249 RepID=A0A9N9X5I2_PHACE|nr:unnamed protein product [Phaedon cochleariae]
MSSNPEEEKDAPKAVPLDLARSQIASLRTIDGKTPLLMTNQSLRNMRVVAQGTSITNTSSLGSPTLITTNLVSQAVLKPDSTRTQITNIIATNPSQSQITGNISRPNQITLSAAPQSIGTSYHVPRGPAVVANLAAPRSTVTTVRAPMVVTAQVGQTHSFVRPPRTPSPAQGTAWLTSSSTGTQIKGAPTVLSSPVRGATVTGKPQIISRAHPQTVSAIRPGTILQNAISIGQSGQIHSFKPGVTGIQALGNTVTIAQVLPSRTQTIVYGTNTTAQFTPTARITVANPNQGQRTPQPRSLGQVTTTRLTVPVNVSQSGTRLVAPQATVLASGTRISTIPTNSGSVGRIVTTQPNVNLGRLSVAAASPTAVSSTNILGQTRISTLNLHSLVVANSSQARSIPAQGAKVITQPAPGTIHLTPLATPVKTTASIVSTTPRTISVPAAIVTQQRQASLVPSQAISIAKVFPQSDSQGAGGSSTNVFIHAPVQSTVRRSSPSPSPYSLHPTPSGAYFYETPSQQQGRPFSQGQTFGPSPQQQASAQALSKTNVNAQVHGILANQQMRFNPVMAAEQPRVAALTQAPSSAHSQQFPSLDHAPVVDHAPKVSSSPRPSILRKRDHEGSPLKAAKNLTPVLVGLPTGGAGQHLAMGAGQLTTPPSPPSRPDSRGNGHSSGGSTTISATSSPGPVELNEDSNPGLSSVKEEEESKPPLEMSPRKKPRKQQLTGNDMDELDEEMQFISDNPSASKKDKDKDKDDDSDADNQSDEPKDGAPEASGSAVTTVRKPVSASLLNGYRQHWKATHNHYLRHSDVKPKEERRPSIMDLANQCRVQEKVNGWKVHHLSTQMEDLAEQEQTVYDQLTGLLKCTESEMGSKHFDKELNRINDLIKGNLQRIKIINDGMLEAKTSIMKIFDHKVYVTDIINRCASKRSFKKREKS